MTETVKTSPQYKITCKQITPKLNIESIDKNTFNDLKKYIAKYNLTIEIIDDYRGELDEHGSPVDVADYEAWKENHPNKISKQSVNNIIKSIKNNSLVNWNADAFGGIGYNAAFCDSNRFDIELFNVYLVLFGKVRMNTVSISISYSDNVLNIEYLNGQFVSQ